MGQIRDSAPCQLSRLMKALKSIRLYYQISQIELARKLDISRSYLCEIESGKKDVSLKILSSYSSVFGIQLASILLIDEALKTGRPIKVIASDCIEKATSITKHQKEISNV